MTIDRILNIVLVRIHFSRQSIARFIMIGPVTEIMLDSVRAKKIMRLHERLKPQPHETRLQELSRERKSETRQLERLAALLAKKTDSATANIPDDKAA